MSFATDLFSIQRKDDKFREYKPNARGNAPRITEEQWEPYLPLIRCLHNARRTRQQILEVLREHGLEPSVAQLYAKMSRWGLKGYGPANAVDVDTTTSAGPNEPAVVKDVVVAGHSPNRENPDEANADSSTESPTSASSDSADCFSSHDVDTSDTVYDTEGPPAAKDGDAHVMSTGSEPTSPHPRSLDELVEADATSTLAESIDASSMLGEAVQQLPSDLMAFVHSTADISEFDQHDILNEVASFLCATSSFSDAFVLFDASYTYLKANQRSSMALVFATINCLRSATFREQCQYAGALMGEALASLRILSYTNPYATTAFSSLEQIGRELCVSSELEHLNILYTQMHFKETSLSTGSSSDSNAGEVLLHCSDPFLLAKADLHPELVTRSMEVSSIMLGRIVGKLGRWCCSAIDDFNPVAMLPSAGFNPSDPVSVARFATALSCHFIRKWSFLSLAEVLGHCNELLPPNRKDTAVKLCKLAVRVLSTLAVYAIYQATGMTLTSTPEDNFLSVASQAQYVSPLAGHLDVLVRMRSKERVAVFAAIHKTLYNRTLVYRQQMDDHCLMAHVRETGFLLAASLIRLQREASMEVPEPAADISRGLSPIRDSRSPSRKSSDSSSSMRNLARRNLLVPGIMSKNGSHLRASWTRRRLSIDSDESWNFTKVTGLPAAPSPPESMHDQMLYQYDQVYDDHGHDGDHDSDHEMTGTDKF